VCDAPPCAPEPRAGRLVSVPYTTELGDLPMIVVQHRSTREWVDGLRAQFDCLWAEGARQPRVLGIGLHAYIAGTPQRIGPPEALLEYMRRKKGVGRATGEEIYDWWTGQGDSR